jgi:ATP-binding cassette subfamily B protein/subfamily B ATP-binding cassette protein MsbA
MERVFDILDLAKDKADLAGALRAPKEVNDLRFDRVTFAYVAGRPVVRDLSFVANRGMVIALVGRSGAGKSTVADLIARFHDPSDGRILINGFDIRGVTLGSYRELISIVQQATFLFDGSVCENIAYGCRSAGPAEIEQAAKLANAHEFIVDLPDGYDTLIGPCGITLSGGQQQRLAVARAVVSGAQIVIFDEATSNLDSESEAVIRFSLSTLRKERLVFVIAHRLSTVAQADLILVIDNGSLIESGDHETLMDRRGVYHQMVARQRIDCDSQLSVKG